MGNLTIEDSLIIKVKNFSYLLISSIINVVNFFGAQNFKTNCRKCKRNESNRLFKLKQNIYFAAKIYLELRSSEGIDTWFLDLWLKIRVLQLKA